MTLASRFRCRLCRRASVESSESSDGGCVVRGESRSLSVFFLNMTSLIPLLLESTVNKRHQLMAGMHNIHIIYYIFIL